MVVLNNGFRYLGAVRTVDKEHGFSLVKINPKNKLNPIRLGDSSKVKPGEFCIAAGWNSIPTQIPNIGLISATDQTYQSWIQTGPIVNDQNAGGPLLDIFGNAIGINSALWAKRGEPLAGFESPINKIKDRIKARVQIGRGKTTITPPLKLLKTQKALVAIITKRKDYTVNISLLLGGKQKTLGSGVIVSNEGYIITNNHIVEGVHERLRVRTGDKRQLIGKVLKRYPMIDLALIGVNDYFDLEGIPIGDYNELKYGEILLSIGNPFGLEHTVDYGVAMSIGNLSHVSSGYDVIQTDIPIHPGNSGGPLINIKGELVGINMATWMKDRAVLLIPPKTGYALSITKDTIAKMIKGKDVEGSIYP